MTDLGHEQDSVQKGPFDLELLLHKDSNDEIEMSHRPDRLESWLAVRSKAYPSKVSRIIILI